MRHEEDLDEVLHDERAKSRGVTELFRKVVVSGVGALFMTEEGIRTAVKELKLPKEALASALAQADKTKAEVLRIVGTEVRTFLQSAALQDELIDVLTKLQWEIRAEVAFQEGEGGLPRPVLDAKVQVKRRPGKRAKKTDPEAESD